MKVKLIWFVVLMFAAAAKGQKSGGMQLDKSVGECHHMLGEFAGKDSTYFQNWDSGKTLDTLSKIEACARDSYSQLPKLDLAVAVVVSQWLKDNQYTELLSIMSTRNKELQSKVDQFTKTTTSSANEMQITIETLPLGFTRTLNIGGNQDKCTADGPESMHCEKYVPNLGYWPDAELTAMMARVKTGYGSSSYLIGCPPSVNCAPLVPGEYSGTMSGSDGLVIAGLVSESKTEETPRHGIYTILSRY